MENHYIEVIIEVSYENEFDAIEHMRKLGWEHIQDADFDDRVVFKQCVNPARLELADWEQVTKNEITSPMFGIVSVTHMSVPRAA